jgi:hypothetical protein
MGWEPALEVAALHTASYLITSALVAVAVYQRFGVTLLRTRWVNLDVLWAGALILTAVATALV